MASSFVVRTRTLTPPGPLLRLLPEGRGLSWGRRAEGAGGWGGAAELPGAAAGASVQRCAMSPDLRG